MANMGETMNTKMDERNQCEGTEGAGGKRRQALTTGCIGAGSLPSGRDPWPPWPLRREGPHHPTRTRPNRRHTHQRMPVRCPHTSGRRGRRRCRRRCHRKGSGAVGGPARCGRGHGLQFPEERKGPSGGRAVALEGQAAGIEGIKSDRTESAEIENVHRGKSWTISVTTDSCRKTRPGHRSRHVPVILLGAGGLAVGSNGLPAPSPPPGALP